MSKYIIEIKPEHEDSFKGLMLLGAKDSNLFVDTVAVEDLEELTADYINENFGELQDTAYQRGLNDAWECARKLFSSMADSDIEKAFPTEWNNGGFHALINLQPREAIAKMKAYEEKQKTDNCIEIGDEVKWDGNKCIVTNRHIDINMGIIQDYDLMSCEGSVVAHVKRRKKMKWPTMDEFAQMVADKAIDEVEYNGKTLRQWVEIIAASELSTNLAEVGTDAVSREQAIDIAKDLIITVEGYEMHNQAVMNYCADIMQLPPIQPEIVRCKYCRHYRHGLCMKASMCVNKSENGFCDWAERREANESN